MEEKESVFSVFVYCPRLCSSRGVSTHTDSMATFGLSEL